jgi:uncharacterized protein
VRQVLFEKEWNPLKAILKSFTTELAGTALLGVLLLFYFKVDPLKGLGNFSVPDAVLNVNTIFLSILFEAIPFILLGVFFSAFVSEESLQRLLPKNPWLALLPATLLAAVFPVCECAIIPVARRLIKKGMPLHVGVVLIVAAPILNPIVVASTFFAFRTQLTILYARIGLGFLLAMVIGAMIYLFFKNSPQLKWNRDELIGDVSGTAPSSTRKLNRWKQAMYHAADEFFETGKYLIIGAFLAALFQTFFDRKFLTTIASHQSSSTLVMMGFAYFISLCSEADAFVAATFTSKFTIGSILAFLVYGPMLDLKTTIMLFAYFRTKFVLVFIATVTLTVFTAIMVLQKFIL